MTPSSFPPDDDRDHNGWRLDKHVPVALIVAMAVQILVVGTWYGRTEQRLSNIESWITQNSQTDHRLTQVETKIDGVQQTLNGIARKLGGTP